MAWARHVIRGSERGNSGKSRGSRYIYFVFFCFVPFSPYLSIVIMTLPLSCVRPSLIHIPPPPTSYIPIPSQNHLQTSLFLTAALEVHTGKTESILSLVGITDLEVHAGKTESMNLWHTRYSTI